MVLQRLLRTSLKGHFEYNAKGRSKIVKVEKKMNKRGCEDSKYRDCAFKTLGDGLKEGKKGISVIHKGHWKVVLG